MSTDQVPSGSDPQASGDAEVQPNQDKVSYSTYQKVLGEKKKERAEKEQLQARLKEFEQKDLEVKGKDKELIEALRKENEESKQKISKTVQSFANRVINQEIATAAAKYGCEDTDLLLKVINPDALEFDVETFSVKQEDLKREIERAMKEKPILFKKSGPKVHDIPPTSANPLLNAEGKKKSIDELTKEFAKLNNKQ